MVPRSPKPAPGGLEALVLPESMVISSGAGILFTSRETRRKPACGGVTSNLPQWQARRIAKLSENARKEEVARMLADAKQQRNYRACRNGYGYCDRSHLTPSEASAIQAETTQVSR